MEQTKHSKVLQKSPHPHSHHQHLMHQHHKLDWQKENTLPITVVSGFLGSGKTSLLKHALQNTEGKKIAVIVNDLAQVNIDAEMVKKSTSEREMVELTNGCMCCTLKTDLLVEIKKLARKGAYQYLIIEGSGVAEPMPVAEGIATFDIGRGKLLTDIVRLDTMVTVVDSYNFLKDFNAKEGVLDREELIKELGLAPPPQNEGQVPTKEEKKIVEALEKALAETPNHPISSLLAEQVEFANVILLNKVDMISEEDLMKLEEIIRALNPAANIIKTRHSKVCLDEVLNTHLFDFEQASNAAGWLKLIKGEFVAQAKEIGINSFVYRARRPFHPKKLWDLVESDLLSNVVRSKGFFWLATWNDKIGDWGHAGAIYNFRSDGNWFVTVPESEWPGDESMHTDIKKDFDSTDPKIGDRRQELVFIGVNICPASLSRALDDCLLSDEEWQMGAEAWKQEFEDPFEEWMNDDDDDMGPTTV